MVFFFSPVTAKLLLNANLWPMMAISKLSNESRSVTFACINHLPEETQNTKQLRTFAIRMKDAQDADQLVELMEEYKCPRRPANRREDDTDTVKATLEVSWPVSL